ncbi:hypothetical protein AWB69_04262 [Caballeronia udeis]|uniref:Uncharacterized protein n=1 Tax=Caballeronia udeis TaxID=1232866 RepID=A0A158HCU6_9BURK|nr:hypothetical protein [Caballeronia udeis]SAL42214.1 hypothetical protein AWB69_04262 [Caballeronia udeis]
MTGFKTSKFSHSAAQYVDGVKGLALPNFARSWLGLHLATMGLVRLILIAPASMTDGLTGSAVCPSLPPSA